MSAPFVVPADECTPWPADFTRLLSTLEEMGYRADILVEGRAAGAVFDQVPFLLSIDASGRFLSIRAVWETGLSQNVVGQWVFAASDSWNREKYFPTIYWLTSPEGTVQVCADFVVDVSAGISTEQLRENISAGISTGISAMEYMRQAAEETLPSAESASEPRQ